MSSNDETSKKEGNDIEKQEVPFVTTAHAPSSSLATKDNSSGTDASFLIQHPQTTQRGLDPEGNSNLLKDHTSDTSSTTDRLHEVRAGVVHGNHREKYIDHSHDTIPIIPVSRRLRDNSSVHEAGFEASTLIPGTKPRSKRWIGLAVLLLVVVVTVSAVVGGLCADGSCGKDNASLAQNVPSSTFVPITLPTAAPTSFRFKAFDTTEELYDAVDRYLQDLSGNAAGNASDVAFTYGYPIGTWDVSRIQDFSFVFALNRDATLEDVRGGCAPDTESFFNEDLSGWDMSNATKLTAMFSCNVVFTGESIAKWNVSNVEFLNLTFSGAKNFNANLGSWDTSKVVTLAFAFFDALEFEGNGLANWNTGSVTDMYNTFNSASSFVMSNDNVGTWNTSSVKNMRGLFAGTSASPDVDLSQWDTSRVENMGYMFHTTNFNGDISMWNTSMVTDMSYMFQSNQAFDQDLSSWDVRRVQTLEGIFVSTARFSGGNIGSWNTSSCTSMRGSFAFTTNFNVDLSAWDVSKVIHMDGMFVAANGFNSDLSAWDVSQATRMDAMFANASQFDSDLSLWNVSRVTNMNAMFANAESFNSDLSAWDVSSVMDFSTMFLLATSFNQSLCAWSERVPSTASLTSMFTLTSCLSEELPVFDTGSQVWTGPWCHPCDEPTFIPDFGT